MGDQHRLNLHIFVLTGEPPHDLHAWVTGLGFVGTVSLFSAMGCSPRQP